MRELGREGSVVAATIATLHSRSASDGKHRASKLRASSVQSCNSGLRSERDDLRRVSGCSERPLSTASEASERDSASVQSSEEPPPNESGDSDSPDEATVKCTAWPDGAIPARANSSDTESTSSADDDSDLQDFEVRSAEANYRTLTPSRRRLDNSTRRDDNFKWMPPENMSDIVEPTSMESRTEEHQASGSLDRRRRVPADRNDRDRKTRSSMSTKPPQHPSSVRASPRPRRSRVEETPPELQRRWNSYEHFRWGPSPDGGPGGWWPPMCWCHGPPAPPPCCMHDRSWPSHPSLPPVPSRTYKV